jgi:hypothetical protein
VIAFASSLLRTHRLAAPEWLGKNDAGKNALGVLRNVYDKCYCCLPPYELTKNARCKVAAKEREIAKDFE